MVRAPADLRIENVSPDSTPPGFDIDPEITVFNQNTSPAPGETHDLGWVRVESPDYDKPVVWSCFVIEPQTSVVVDGCSTVISPCGNAEMPTQSVILDITVGGHEGGTNCADAPFVGNTTDQIGHRVSVPPAEGSFLIFNTGGDGETESGPFPPGSTPSILEYSAINSGDSTGDMMIQIAELDQNGNVVNILCSNTFADMQENQFFGIEHHADGNTCNPLIDIDTVTIRPQLTSQFGVTQHFGIKVWSEDEQEPSYPTSQMSVRTHY